MFPSSPMDLYHSSFNFFINFFYPLLTDSFVFFFLPLFPFFCIFLRFWWHRPVAGQVVLKAKPHMLWEAPYSLAVACLFKYSVRFFTRYCSALFPGRLHQPRETSWCSGRGSQVVWGCNPLNSRLMLRLWGNIVSLLHRHVDKKWILMFQCVWSAALALPDLK